jgi:hypothetical protein
MKPNADYIVKEKGVRSVLQEIEKSFDNMPFAARFIWMMVFRTLNWASENGTALSKNVAVLTEKQASELGLGTDYPCLYIELHLGQKIVMPLCRVMIRLQSYSYSRMRDRWASGFIPGNFPGLITTSYSKEELLQRKRKQKKESNCVERSGDTSS